MIFAKNHNYFLTKGFKVGEQNEEITCSKTRVGLALVANAVGAVKVYA